MKPEVLKNKIEILWKDMQKSFIRLYERWQDEKEYENWKDYEKYLLILFHLTLRKNKIKDVSFLKATKKPFGMTFEIYGIEIYFYVNSKSYNYKVVE